MTTPDRYITFSQLLADWESNNYTNFAELESFFFREILPDQNPDRLRYHVEMHRLIKLIKSDLAMLNLSRSASRSQEYQAKIRERSIGLSQLCKHLLD